VSKSDIVMTLSQSELRADPKAAMKKTRKADRVDLTDDSGKIVAYMFRRLRETPRGVWTD
jgi:hypothetical protein